MIKKILISVLFLILYFAPLAGDWNGVWNFLDTGIALNAGITKVNGTDFNSLERKAFAGKSTGLITMTFTRAAGSGSTVDFYFQVSFDGGTTWADYIESIGIATNHSVISGTMVTVSKPINLGGISHIRWSKVVNNDVSNNLTAVNATLSI
jgi:hypothetical protein